MTAVVWLLGRWRFASPWRHGKDRKPGTSFLNSADTPLATAARSPKANMTPAVNHNPWSQLAVVITANAATPATIRKKISHSSGSLPRSLVSYEARRATSGEIFLSGSKGMREKRIAAPRPIIIPAPTPTGATGIDALDGRKSLSPRGRK